MKFLDRVMRLLYLVLPFVIVCMPIFLILAGFTASIRNSLVYLVAALLIMPNVMCELELLSCSKVSIINTFSTYFVIFRSRILRYFKLSAAFVTIIWYLIVSLVISLNLYGANWWLFTTMPFLILFIAWFICVTVLIVSNQNENSSWGMICKVNKFIFSHWKMLPKAFISGLLGFLVLPIFGWIFQAFALAIGILLLSKFFTNEKNLFEKENEILC